MRAFLAVLGLIVVVALVTWFVSQNEDPEPSAASVANEGEDLPPQNVQVGRYNVQIRQQPAVLVPGQSGTLRMTFTIREGESEQPLHWNAEAPSRIAVGDDVPRGLRTETDTVPVPRGQAGEVSRTVEIPIAVTENAAPGERELPLKATLFVCTEGEGALCLTDRETLSVPVMVGPSPAGASAGR